MQNERGIERQSNIELLRIVAIIMVIGLHYLLFGGFTKNIETSSINYYLIDGIRGIFIIAVNLFVIVSAYFLVDIEKINYKKIIPLVGKTLFYGIFFLGIGIILKIENFSIGNVIETIVYGLKNWYVKTYIVLYLLAPYLNIVIKNIDKEKYKRLILLLTGLFCIWPSFLPGAPNNDSGYGIITFVYIFFLIGYIKKYFALEKIKRGYLIVGYLISVIGTFTFLRMGWTSALNYNFLFNIIGAIFLFLIFSKIKLKCKLINKISKLTFGVFIIHIDKIFIEIIYNKILKCNSLYEENFVILYIIFGVIVIYVISLIIKFFISKVLEIFKLLYLKRGDKGF